ncbi:MAG TPA: hypothetical protein VN722_07500 [Hanamia sp.]|nr:hypothetical protein [Hanamia sp.]
MSTKLLMTVSAIILGVTGIILSFFPVEVSNYLGFAGTEFIILQILGALYFAFGLINWTAKANLIGGIYSRPVAIGNFAHFMIGALALVKLSFHSAAPSYIWIAAVIYSTFAVFFGYIFFTSPVAKNKSV